MSRVTVQTLHHDIESIARKNSELSEKTERKSSVLVEGRRIRCHVSALKRIPFFRGCIEFNDSDHLIDLSDSGLSFEGVGTCIRFVYTFEFVDEAYARKHLTEILSHRNFQDVLEASNYLQINEVSELCCQFVKTHLEASNVYDVLQMSVTLHLENLTDFVLNYIGFHFRYLSTLDNVGSISLECIKLILPRERMLIDSNDDVVSFAVKWLKSRKTKVEPNLESEILSLADKKRKRRWPLLLIVSYNDCPFARYLGKEFNNFVFYEDSEDTDDTNESEDEIPPSFEAIKIFKETNIDLEEQLIRSYDPETGKWGSKDDFSRFVSEKHGFLLLGDKDYLIAINRSDTCEDCSAPAPVKRDIQSIWRLHIEENKWTKVCSFREELIGPMKVALVQGVLYVVGIDGDLDIVQRKYDLNAAEPEGRCFGDEQISPELFYNSILTSSSDTLYLLECQKTKFKILSITKKEDKKWTIQENCDDTTEILKDSSVSFLDDDTMIATGGRNPTSSSKTMMWKIKDNVWISLPNMKSGRFAHGSAVIDGKVYAVGGRGFYSREIIRNVEVHDVRKRRWTGLDSSSSTIKHYFPNNAVALYKPLRLM